MATPALNRLIRISEVCTRTASSPSWVWRQVRAGLAPKPVKVSSGITAWVESEVDAWIAEMIAGARADEAARLARGEATVPPVTSKKRGRPRKVPPTPAAQLA